MANNLKTLKVSLPEDSPIYQDVVKLAQEMGVQPAEAAKSALMMWSRSMRGIPIPAAMIPQTFQTKAEPDPVKKSGADIEREKTQSRMSKLGKGLSGLDDE